MDVPRRKAALSFGHGIGPLLNHWRLWDNAILARPASADGDLLDRICRWVPRGTAGRSNGLGSRKGVGEAGG